MTDSIHFKGQGLAGKTFTACVLAATTLLATLNEGIAADYDVVVADSEATVYVVNPRTQARTIIAQQDKLERPYDVAIDAKGNVVVSDTGTMRIVRVGLATGAQTVLAQGPALGVPFGIDVDQKGKVFVANSSAIVCVSPNGKIDPFATGGQLKVPLDVAVGGDGNVYVADAAAGVVQINIRNRRQTVIAGIGGAGFLSTPTGITVDANQIAYVVDGGGQCVVAVDLVSRNQELVLAAGALATPVGIAVAPDGSILVSDPDAFEFAGGIFAIGQEGVAQPVAYGSDQLVNARGIAVVPSLQ